MTIDNLVQLDVIKQISAVDGKPSIVEVSSNGTSAADDLIARVFTNDTVRFLNEEWRVWKISGKTLTLVRE